MRFEKRSPDEYFTCLLLEFAEQFVFQFLCSIFEKSVVDLFKHILQL